MAKVLVDKLVQVQDKSPASKAVVRLRCELTGTNNEAHITLVNNGATKNLIKSIGRLKLTERITTHHLHPKFAQTPNLLMC